MCVSKVSVGAILGLLAAIVAAPLAATADNQFERPIGSLVQFDGHLPPVDTGTTVSSSPRQLSMQQALAESTPQLADVYSSAHHRPLVIDTHAPVIVPETPDPNGTWWERRIRCYELLPFFSGDASLADVMPVSEPAPRRGLIVSVDYDTFRGVPDGGWQNNGVRIGFNGATRLGGLSDRTGVGGQIGASAGAYNWAGTDYRFENQDRAQSQGFLTYGLFHRANDHSRVVAGVVQDWMFNDTYGFYGTNATLSQLRWQVGYTSSASNEYGFWGTAHVHNAHLEIAGLGPVTYQPISQLNGYWHHKWRAGGPDSWISIGTPMEQRLNNNGSLGDYQITAAATCPLSSVVALNSSITYMHQTGSPGPSAATEDAWNFSVGIAIYPGRNAYVRQVAGQQWMPLFPVANNGSLLVDADNWY